MGQDKHRQTGAIGMETLNSLSALPAAIVEPIGFVGFPSLATAVSLRRNFLPSQHPPKTGIKGAHLVAFIEFFLKMETKGDWGNFLLLSRPETPATWRLPAEFRLRSARRIPSTRARQSNPSSNHFNSVARRSHFLSFFFFN